LKEGDVLVLMSNEGPIVATVRALLMPQPLRELRVKNAYISHSAVMAAQGVKVTAKGELEKVLPGTNLMVAKRPDEIEVLKVYYYYSHYIIVQDWIE
jgi:translation initiation factor 5B